MVDVERILLTEWDPVGVKGEPMAEGEYGSLAGIVASMLASGVSEAAVAEYLGRVQSEMFGSGPDSMRCNLAAHKCKMLLA